MPRIRGFVSDHGFSIVAGGKVCPEIVRGTKTFVPVTIGEKFELELFAPRDCQRYEYVVSIDGLNALNGEIATPEDSGFVVTGRVRIPGFEVGGKVVPFQFIRQNERYGELPHTPTVSGVITVKMFAETRALICRPGAMDSGAYRGSGGAPGFGGELEAFGALPTYPDDGRPTGTVVTGMKFARRNEVASFSIEYAPAALLEEAGIRVNEPETAAQPYACDAPPVLSPPM